MISSFLGFLVHGFWDHDEIAFSLDFYLWKVNVFSVYLTTYFATVYEIDCLCPHNMPRLHRVLRTFEQLQTLFFSSLLILYKATPFAVCAVSALISFAVLLVTLLAFVVTCVLREPAPALPAASPTFHLCMSLRPRAERWWALFWCTLSATLTAIAFLVQLFHVGYPPWLHHNVIFHCIIQLEVASVFALALCLAGVEGRMAEGRPTMRKTT